MKEISVHEIRSALTRLDRLLARVLSPRATEKMPSHADFRVRIPRLKVGSERYVRQDRDER